MKFYQNNQSHKKMTIINQFRNYFQVDNIFVRTFKFNKKL